MCKEGGGGGGEGRSIFINHICITVYEYQFDKSMLVCANEIS